MATQKIQLPKMSVISREEVAERAAAEKMEKAMKEKFSEAEFPKEHERFSGFLKTLDAEKIRISVTGKDGKTEEHSFSAQEAQDQSWRLLAAREAGALVKVTPEHKEHNYVVVSGLTESSLKTMKEDGYGPAMVTETDAGRFQAVFKIRAGAEGEREEIQKTLCNRYGNGQTEGIVVPGFYGNSIDRIPRVVSMNEAAPVLGPGRLVERLKEQAPAYAEQERAMKAFASEQPQTQPHQQGQSQQEQAYSGYSQKKEETQDQTQAAQGNSLFNMLLAALRAIALILRDIFANALSRVRVPGLSVQEHKAEPPFWRDKSQWKTEELLQRPEFSRDQKLAAEAPAQEKMAEIKAQAREEVQKQEQNQAKTQKRKGRSR